MKPTDHPEKKPQPKEGTARKQHSLEVTRGLKTAAMVALQEKLPRQSLLPPCSPSSPTTASFVPIPRWEKTLNALAQEEACSPGEWYDTQRSCGGAPTLHLAALSHPCQRQAVENSHVSQGLANRQHGQTTTKKKTSHSKRINYQGNNADTTRLLKRSMLFSS